MFVYIEFVLWSLLLARACVIYRRDKYPRPVWLAWALFVGAVVFVDYLLSGPARLLVTAVSATVLLMGGVMVKEMLRRFRVARHAREQEMVAQDVSLSLYVASLPEKAQRPTVH